jgi:hypothetical protein
MAVITERAARRPPYEAYAVITGVFAGGLALAGGLARLLGRDVREHTWLDLVALTGATLLAGVGINDFLQAGYTALMHKANELEWRGEG